MELNVKITAIETEALRRAIANLAAEERARFLARGRPSRIEQACESLYEKIFERKVE